MKLRGPQMASAQEGPPGAPGTPPLPPATPPPPGDPPIPPAPKRRRVAMSDDQMLSIIEPLCTTLNFFVCPSISETKRSGRSRMIHAAIVFAIAAGIACSCAVVLVSVVSCRYATDMAKGKTKPALIKCSLGPFVKEVFEALLF